MGNRSIRRGEVHAVVTKVNVGSVDAALGALREQVVPRVSQIPGFVAGYWTRQGDTGLSMVIFESEDQASGAAEQVPSMLPEGVTLESVEVREVVASA
jgi:hypothetical protein